jgi:hypothetical protein
MNEVYSLLNYRCYSLLNYRNTLYSLLNYRYSLLNYSCYSLLNYNIITFSALSRGNVVNAKQKLISPPIKSSLLKETIAVIILQPLTKTAIINTSKTDSYVDCASTSINKGKYYVSATLQVPIF